MCVQMFIHLLWATYVKISIFKYDGSIHLYGVNIYKEVNVETRPLCCYSWFLVHGVLLANADVHPKLSLKGSHIIHGLQFGHRSIEPQAKLSHGHLAFACPHHLDHFV